MQGQVHIVILPVSVSQSLSIESHVPKVGKRLTSEIADADNYAIVESMFVPIDWPTTEPDSNCSNVRLFPVSDRTAIQSSLDSFSITRVRRAYRKPLS